MADLRALKVKPLSRVCVRREPRSAARDLEPPSNNPEAYIDDREGDL